LPEVVGRAVHDRLRDADERVGLLERQQTRSNHQETAGGGEGGTEKVWFGWDGDGAVSRVELAREGEVTLELPLEWAGAVEAAPGQDP
jgi:hypothetical protein